ASRSAVGSDLEEPAVPPQMQTTTPNPSLKGGALSGGQIERSDLFLFAVGSCGDVHPALLDSDLEEPAALPQMQTTTPNPSLKGGALSGGQIERSDLFLLCSKY
ncbi:hypothetical protein, partial [uncultured Alistipes sp.]|uniref:hypothetical protein n=1 Tax=uncultured Alistipes sp. TaxID=538949 RepID=UPI00261BC1FA